jgi:hypothetical protein
VHCAVARLTDFDRGRIGGWRLCHRGSPVPWPHGAAHLASAADDAECSARFDGGVQESNQAAPVEAWVFRSTDLSILVAYSVARKAAWAARARGDGAEACST